MDFPATIAVITVVLVEIQGMNFYAGRQVQNYSSHLSAQPEKQHHAESILYLTPSQIKALREGEFQLYRTEVFHADSVTHHHAPEYQEAPEQQQIVYLPPHHDGNPHSQFVYPQPNTTPAIPQSPKDPFHIIPPPNFREPKTIEYNTFQTQEQKRILKPIPFFPDSDKQSHNNKPKAEEILKKPTTQKPVQETDADDQLTRQQLKEQWLHILKQNIAHFKALEVLYKNQILSNHNNTNFHYLAQNDDSHNDKYHASEGFNLIRSNNQDQLNKQRTVLQSETVANAPPLPYDDINIKQIPAPFVAHAAGPQTPEFFSVPESFEDKNPQTYEFPIEYFRTVSYPNVKMQTNEVDRPAPTQAEVQIPFAVTNNVYYGDKPFSPIRGVPVKNAAPNRDNQDSWPPYMREQRH